MIEPQLGEERTFTFRQFVGFDPQHNPMFKEFTNRYKVLGYLGSSSRSACYKVQLLESFLKDQLQELSEDRLFTLKIVDKYASSDEFSEIKNLKLLRAPLLQQSIQSELIQKLFLIADQGDQLVIVQQYITHNMAQFFQYFDSIYHEDNLSVVKDVMIQLCKAVNQLHENNIAHRNICTSDVLFDYNQQRQKLKVFLADFNMARIISDLVGTTISARGSYFSAPELNSFCPGQESSPELKMKLDCWSLGVMAHWMIFGEDQTHHYFTKKERTEWYIKHYLSEYLKLVKDDFLIHLMTGFLVIDPEERMAVAQVMSASSIKSEPHYMDQICYSYAYYINEQILKLDNRENKDKVVQIGEMQE